MNREPTKGEKRQRIYCSPGLKFLIKRTDTTTVDIDALVRASLTRRT
jgi:hypothetical protein